MALRHAALLLVLASPTLLGGCVSSADVAGPPEPPPVLRITYISDPPGALVVDSAGKAWGRAPTTLSYPTALAALQRGQCVHPWSITMHWASGAQQTEAPTACPAEGLNQQLVIERPKDAPHLDLDVQFGAAEEQARASREAAAVQARAVAAIEAADAAEAQAADDAAVIGALGAVNAASNAARQGAAAAASTTHCTSRTVGQGQYAHVETDCN